MTNGRSANSRAAHLSFAAIVVALMTLMATGCQHETDANESEPPRLPPQAGARYSSTKVETATPRGLIAAILTHLNPDDVKSAAFSVPDERYDYPPGVEPSAGYVMVDLKDGTSIGFTASDLVPDSFFSCALDTGYDAIQCSDHPYRFIGDRRAEGDVSEDGPDFEGRTRSVNRGEVLIQIWTDEPTADAVDLVRSLLDDSHLGMRTTVGLNALGETLDNVETLDVQASLTAE